MIRSNLGVLLAERKISAAKASKDTGISRNTLSLITSNSAKGIQYDTLNTLCRYLGITPGELFVYAPFDIEVCPIGKTDQEVKFRIKDKQKERIYTLGLMVSVDTREVHEDDEIAFIPEYISVYVDPDNYYNENNSEKINQLLELYRYLCKLPRSIITELEEDIVHYVTINVLDNLSILEISCFDDDCKEIETSIDFDFEPQNG